MLIIAAAAGGPTRDGRAGVALQAGLRLQEALPAALPAPFWAGPAYRSSGFAFCEMHFLKERHGGRRGVKGPSIAPPACQQPHQESWVHIQEQM